MKTNNRGITYLFFMGILVIVAVAMGYVAVNVANEAKQQLREDSALSSKEAAEAYLNQSPKKSGTVPNVPASSNQTSTSSTAKTSADSSKQIAGNSKPTVAPVTSPNVAPPKTSIDSIRTFFSAIKSGDFVTANALMGPSLATELASISNTSDTTKALSACKSNSTCSLVLNSFQPPSEGYKVTQYAAKTGSAGEQISFPLSKSSPAVANQIGDYNIDIFSEKYAGDVWVIQDVYINGSPISSYF